MKHLLIPSLLSLLTVGCLASLTAGDDATPPNPPPPPELDGKDPAAQAEKLNELKDRNPERFKLIDSDSNGTISPEEAKAFFEKEKAARKAKMQEALDAAFVSADKDKDGKLDKAEFNAATEILRDKVRDQMKDRMKERDRPKGGKDRKGDKGEKGDEGTEKQEPPKPF